MRGKLSVKYKPTFFFWTENEWSREQMQDQGWWDWLCKGRKTRREWCTVSKWISLLIRFFLVIRLSRFSKRVKIEKSFKKPAAYESQRIIRTLYLTTGNQLNFALTMTQKNRFEPVHWKEPNRYNEPDMLPLNDSFVILNRAVGNLRQTLPAPPSFRTSPISF